MVRRSGTIMGGPGLRRILLFPDAMGPAAAAGKPRRERPTGRLRPPLGNLDAGRRVFATKPPAQSRHHGDLALGSLGGGTGFCRALLLQRGGVDAAANSCDGHKKEAASCHRIVSPDRRSHRHPALCREFRRAHRADGFPHRLCADHYAAVDVAGQRAGT